MKKTQHREQLSFIGICKETCWVLWRSFASRVSQGLFAGWAAAAGRGDHLQLWASRGFQTVPCPQRCLISRFRQLPAECTDFRQVQAEHAGCFGSHSEVPGSPPKIYGGKDFTPRPKLAASAFLGLAFMCLLGTEQGSKPTLKQTLLWKIFANSRRIKQGQSTNSLFCCKYISHENSHKMLHVYSCMCNMYSRSKSAVPENVKNQSYQERLLCKTFISF